MNQDKAIFMSQCSALPLKNNEILVLILPFKSAYYLFLVPKWNCTVLFFYSIILKILYLEGFKKLKLCKHST
jgi:hypothetical protein